MCLFYGLAKLVFTILGVYVSKREGATYVKTTRKTITDSLVDEINPKYEKDDEANAPSIDAESFQVFLKVFVLEDFDDLKVVFTLDRVS